MRFTKYKPRRRKNTKIDRNAIWVVYHSSLYRDYCEISFRQLGDGNDIDIQFDGYDFAVYINGEYEDSFEPINGRLNSVVKVAACINMISRNLMDDNIIRGMLGDGIFDSGAFYSNIHALHFCKECVNLAEG